MSSLSPEAKRRKSSVSDVSQCSSGQAISLVVGYSESEVIEVGSSQLNIQMAHEYLFV